MKSKKKLGAAALIAGGFVAGGAMECGAQSGTFSDNPEGAQNDTLSIIPEQLMKVDKSGLKQRLQKLATVGHIFDKPMIADTEYWNIFSTRAYIPSHCTLCKEVSFCDCGCRETAAMMYGDVRAVDPSLYSDTNR